MKISRPVKVKHTYAQTINAPPAAVFPLLCPVRETEWVKGWDPKLVLTESGVVEKDCVFVMEDRPVDSIWVVTNWDPQQYSVQFVKVTPGLTVAKIEIQLSEAKGGKTYADVTYGYTAMSSEGEKIVKDFTRDHYEGFMREWESELNAFLEKRS